MLNNSEYNELKIILNKLDIPKARKRIIYSNIPWLLENVKVKKAKVILNKCDRNKKGYSPINDPIHINNLYNRNKKCETLVKKYADKGIIIDCGVYEPVIRQIKLDFSADEWVNLLNMEGEFLPSCCADISAIRDELFDAIRDNGFIKSEKLWEISQIIQHHNDHGDNEVLDRIVGLWEAVKDDVKMNPVAYPLNPNILKDAVSIVSNACDIIEWNSIGTTSTEEQKFEAKHSNLHEFGRLIPAITTIYKSLEKLEMPPVEGWAICEGEKIAQSRRGLAFYQTKEIATLIMEGFNRQERDIKGKHVYVIRRAKVTLRGGIQFLE